jgi:hypothetical protein
MKYVLTLKGMTDTSTRHKKRKEREDSLSPEDTWSLHDSQRIMDNFIAATAVVGFTMPRRNAGNWRAVDSLQVDYFRLLYYMLLLYIIMIFEKNMIFEPSVCVKIKRILSIEGIRVALQGPPNCQHHEPCDRASSGAGSRLW